MHGLGRGVRGGQKTAGKHLTFFHDCLNVSLVPSSESCTELTHRSLSLDYKRKLHFSEMEGRFPPQPVSLFPHLLNGCSTPSSWAMGSVRESSDLRNPNPVESSLGFSQ